MKQKVHVLEQSTPDATSECVIEHDNREGGLNRESAAIGGDLQTLFQASSTSSIVDKPSAAQACRHHWVLESAGGPVSHGSCKLCGARKEFKNLLSDCLRNDKAEYIEWLRKQGYVDHEEEPDPAPIPQVESLLSPVAE
ncbi:MAG: hypothetical protein NTU41_03115 [Chloroflexi bacterium]|nr:hypothetical protein [Chloroflexota bacterium]